MPDMSIKLSLHTQPVVPMEAENISPDKFNSLDHAAISSLNVLHGKESVPLSDFFTVEGEKDDHIEIQGDLSQVKYIGAEMSSGKIDIKGNVGMHLGTCMRGGEITIDGDAGDWVGPEMSGGKITVKGDAGHMVGSVYRGGSSGMAGGEIIIHGNAKNETGHAMRNGLIVIGGQSGDFTGVNMLAGTIISMGQLGIRTGAGMKRGSIISMCDAEVLSTFTYSCIYQPSYLRIMLQYLKQLGIAVKNEQLNGSFHRWCGDAVELNKGELLLLAG